MKTTTKKTPGRRKAVARSREAERLERMYRELGFVYAGAPGTRSPHEIDFGLQRMDPRPRVDLTFSALSIP